MHLVRFEWRYCTSTSVIGRLASIVNIDKKRVLSIPTNFSFQTLGPEFSRNIYPRFIPPYIYIYSLFLTKRPTFFRNQSRSRLNYRWPLRITLLLPSLLWNLKDRSKQGSKEAKEEGKREEKGSCFPEKWKSPSQQTRSLVRDIFTPRRAISGQGHRQRRFLMNRNRVSLHLSWKTTEIISSSNVGKSRFFPLAPPRVYE